MTTRRGLMLVTFGLVAAIAAPESISPDIVAILKSRGYDVDYAPGVVVAQVAAIVSDGGWLQGASDGRSAAGKPSGY